MAREAWTLPSRAALDLRPLRGSTLLLVETRAPATVWVDGMGLVPWRITTDVVAWATLLEWCPVRGSWGAGADQRLATAWELAHRAARWELSAQVFACSETGAVRNAGAFLSCVASDGQALPIGDGVVVSRGGVPFPFDGRGFLAAILAVVSAVNRGEAVLRRSGRAGIARRYEVALRGTGRPHPDDARMGHA